MVRVLNVWCVWKVLRNSSSVGQLYGLTQFEEYIWWTDQRDGALRRAPKRTSSPTDNVKITGTSIGTGLGGPFGIEIVHPYRQPSKGVVMHVYCCLFTHLSICLSVCQRLTRIMTTD